MELKEPLVSSLVDSLVTLELSLVSAYEKLLVDIPGGDLRTRLKLLLRSHRQAAQLLSGRVDGELGTRPGRIYGETDTVLFPGKVNIETLQMHEQHAISQYEAALAAPLLNPGLRSLIETALLPEIRERLTNLQDVELAGPIAAVRV